MSFSFSGGLKETFRDKVKYYITDMLVRVDVLMKLVCEQDLFVDDMLKLLPLTMMKILVFVVFQSFSDSLTVLRTG